MNSISSSWIILLFSLVVYTAQAQNNSSSVLLDVASVVSKPGETVCVEISAQRMTSIVAMQFSVIWDPAILEFSTVGDLNLPGLSDNDFGYSFIAQGALTFAYLVPSGQELPDELAIFSLCFTAKGTAGTSSHVTIVDKPTAVEFVVDINNNAGLLSNYSLIGGNVEISDDSTLSPFRIYTDNALQVNCLTDGTAELAIRAEGGVAPYSFNWVGPGGLTASGETLTALSAGGYVVTASDAAGNTVYSGFNIINSDLSLGSFSSMDASCVGKDDGTASVLVTGGETPVAYHWSSGAMSSSVQGLAAGMYTVTISDVLGCAIRKIVDIAAGPGVSIAPESAKPTCGDSNGAIQLNATSAAGSLTYTWSNGASGDGQTGLSPGVYTVEVGDANACMVRDTFDFSWTAISIEATAECTVSGENPLEYLALASTTGGEGPYRFAWSTGETEDMVENSQIRLPGPGTYSLTVTDTGNCMATTSVSIETCEDPKNLVWPGDTDNNGRVDHYDLLPIGLGYGQIGPTRDQGSLNWQGQASAPWESATPVSKLNYQYADTDGNGKLETADTMGISLHWGKETGSEELMQPLSSRSSTVNLLVEPMLVMPGQLAAFNILLGEEGQRVEEAYGLAFSIRYDDQVIDPGSVKVDIASSWLGDPQSLILLQRNDPSAHRIDIALTRFDQSGISGGGLLGSLLLQLGNEIPGGKLSYDLVFKVENVRLIGPAEEALAVTPLETTATLEQPNNLNHPSILQKIELFPNPARQSVNLHTGDLNVEQVRLLDATGRILQTWNREGSLDLDKVTSSGTYYLQINSLEGLVNVPLVIVRE